MWWRRKVSVLTRTAQCKNICRASTLSPGMYYDLRYSTPFGLGGLHGPSSSLKRKRDRGCGSNQKTNSNREQRSTRLASWNRTSSPRRTKPSKSSSSSPSTGACRARFRRRRVASRRVSNEHHQYNSFGAGFRRGRPPVVVDGWAPGFGPSTRRLPRPRTTRRQ